MPFRAAPFLILALFFFMACGRSQESNSLKMPSAHLAPFMSNIPPADLQAFFSLQAKGPDWALRGWLEKTVRFLRGGEGLRTGENVEELLKLPREQIVERLMADPRFGDMALDFNLYFLGFKPNRIREGGNYDSNIYYFPSALVSAQELLKGGDYFRLLDFEVPAFAVAAKILDRKNEEKQLSNLELFRRRAIAFQTNLRSLINYLQDDPAATLAEACSRHAQTFSSPSASLYGLGIPYNMVSFLAQEPNWYGGVSENCRDIAHISKAKLQDDLENSYSLNQHFFTLFEKFADDAYAPKSLAELHSINFSAFGLKSRFIHWGEIQRSVLLNSSTNLNRKRGAYVLKRFFCDDLTPIGVEDSPNHGGGAHGSQPSCRSCHYKLDPMAGFFRNYGGNFKDVSGLPEIIFDDGAKMDLQHYLDAWRAAKGAGREWEVGLIRSPSDERLNDYGSSLEDLHALLRRAPEVKSCIVKRMFEYAVGEGQTMDPGFMAAIEKDFAERSVAHPAEAFRQLVTQVVLSQTFRQPDPEPVKCYDFAAGSNPQNSPPCRVAYILEKNCAKCHDSAAGNGSLGLKQWIVGPDGRHTFPHLGPGGQQLTLQTTLERIVARLNTSDSEARMPYQRYMSSQDRQALYLWAQELLNGISKK